MEMSLMVYNWREEQDSSGGLVPIGPAGSNRYSRSVATVRESFCKYFSSPAGELIWQYNYIRCTN